MTRMQVQAERRRQAKVMLQWATQVLTVSDSSASSLADVAKGSNGLLIENQTGSGQPMVNFLARMVICLLNVYCGGFQRTLDHDIQYPHQKTRKHIVNLSPINCGKHPRRSLLILTRRRIGFQQFCRLLRVRHYSGPV